MRRGIYNIEDMRRLANRALPSPIRNYLEGGADDEHTLSRNIDAFGDWYLSQGGLTDISRVDTNVELLGIRSSLPVILSPTGMSQLFHNSGEMAVARAAAAEGIAYGLSTMATTSIEDVATTNAERYFQLYLFKDRGLTKALLERAAAQSYAAICLTTDTAVSGNRERDLRTGMVMPPRFGLKNLASFAAHPTWSLGAMRRRSFRLANVADHVGELGPKGSGIIQYINTQFDRTASWSDLEWLRGLWPGKLIIKGLMRPEDCAAAAAAGVDGVMVSNHGGRQLDGCMAPLDCLPAIRDRVGTSLRLILDGGIRRGTHVLKALALGADACSIGRPYLYGLAAGGEAGVRRVIAILRSEIERDMALMGKVRVGDVTPADVHHISMLRARPTGSTSRDQHDAAGALT